VDAPKDLESQERRKGEYKEYMRETLDELKNMDVPRDMLKEQAFLNHIESYTEQAYIYHDEMTKILA